MMLCTLDTSFPPTILSMYSITFLFSCENKRMFFHHRRDRETKMISQQFSIDKIMQIQPSNENHTIRQNVKNIPLTDEQRMEAAIRYQQLLCGYFSPFSHSYDPSHPIGSYSAHVAMLLKH